jgi:proteasome lid subunit RPN8/RPN11
MELDKLFYIPEKDWYELQGWATIAYDEDKNEISGLMTAIPQKDGRYKLCDVEILKQENTGSNTTLDGDAVAAYKMKYAMKYQNKSMKYVWWHSHHTMDAFWSGTDTNEIDEWKNSSFSLALVINLKQEYKFRVSIWNACGLPVEQHYDIPLTVERKNGVKVTDKMKTLYEELCDSPTYGGNIRQTGFNYNNHLVRTNNAHLEMENAFTETVEKLDNLNDSFMEAGLNVKQWQSAINDMNKILKEKKFPFSIKEPKGSKQEIINKLMVTISGDMIKWEDEAIKNQVEQSYIWGGTYGY